ncbi:MAG: NADH-quinone oxidoreductase subunit H, partial [bacterium]
AILTTLFFGVWQIPWIDGSGYHLLHCQGGWEGTWLAGLLTVQGTQVFIMLLQAAKFALFTVAGVYFLLTARWTFPRFRYDQVMKMGWKMVLPLAFLNILITAVVLVFTRGWM